MASVSLISNASEENAWTTDSAPPGTWHVVLISQPGSLSFQSIGTSHIAGRDWSGNGSLCIQRVVLEGLCDLNSVSPFVDASVKVFFDSADDITPARGVAVVS